MPSSSEISGMDSHGENIFNFDMEPYLPDLISPQTYTHQLIILGNGFDLECGLKSRFSDFYEAKKQDKLKALTSRSDKWKAAKENAESDNRLTIWDLILSQHTSSNWCGIEQAIAKWVTDRSMTSRSNTINIRQYIDRVCGYNGAHTQEDVNLFFNFYEFCDAIRNHVSATFDKELDGTCDTKDFLDYLMEELHMLEKQFSDYLRVEADSTAYKTRSRELFLEILQDRLDLEDEDFDVEHSVLNFNYTTIDLEIEERPQGLSFTNVHGRLGGRTIFGIDGKEYMDNPLIAPFTKTYRVLTGSLAPLSKLVRVPTDASFDEGTAIIKFYGHSLGEADYSYFQAIFDALDIYRGETHLLFYCRPDEDYLRKMVDSVTRLLITYGATLDNPDHGKNLIHKLLIEGRLTIFPLF